MVCARDIITHLPFSSVGNSGFKHCGVMVLLDPKGNMLGLLLLIVCCGYCDFDILSHKNSQPLCC